MTRSSRIAIWVGLALGAASCSQAPDGAVLAAAATQHTHTAATQHTHTAGDAGHAEDAIEPIVVTVFTESVELFMEYPELVVGERAGFLAHVTVLATGAPVQSGELRLEARLADSAPIVLMADAPARDGLFIPLGAFDAAGEYEARIVVTSDQVNATIPLDALIVHADRAAAHAHAHARATEEPPDAIPFLLEQQWSIELQTAVVERRALIQRLQMPGEVEAPHHSMAIVSAPLGGRLIPPADGHLPVIGERVEAGQVLGYIEPPRSLGDSAQLSANEVSHATREMEILALDFDLQSRALDVALTHSQARAQLEFARGNLARIEALRAKDLGTIGELEAARRDVQLAEQSVAGSEDLSESLARALARLDGLRESSNAAGRPVHATSYPLVAPISAEVVEVHHVEGEQVDSLAPIIRLLDLERVWIVTHVSEFDLALLGDQPSALLEFAAFPDRRFDLLGALDGSVVHIGRVVDPETRTIKLHYEAANPDGLLRAGMFADVYLETGRAVDAVAVPVDAVVMENGQRCVYVLLDGEHFQKRALDVGVRDGNFIEVRSGLEAGERVVTRGAYMLKAAAASPASFGEGHAH